MPPFQYSTPENRSANSIAALMQRSGDIEAQRAAASGQIWGQAVQGIGSAVAGTIQQATDPKRQVEAAQLADLKRVQAARPVLANAIKQFSDPATGVDHEKVAQAVSAAGFPDQAESWLKMSANNAESLSKLRDLNQKFQQEQAGAIGDLAFHATSAQDFNSALGLAATAGLIDEAGAHRFAAQTDAAGPEGWQGLKAKLEQLSPTWKKRQEELTKPMIVPEGASIANAGGEVLVQGKPKPPTEAELALQAAGGDPAAAMDRLKPKPQESAQTKSVLLDNKPAEVTWEPKSKQWTDASGQPITNAAARIKPIPPASSTMVMPSGDALTMAARRYLATGELPSMGMGQAGAAARVAVMNEAAKIDPQASLAQNAATFKADSANLKNLQTTEGTLSAFETTAGKNLDQFLSLAAKIPDTGVPWINQPVRTVNAKGLGSADQAAFDAARDVALREIARVTNDPKLSGVLSDAARKEVSGLSAQSATFAQIKAVAKVLKQDMANVHAGLTQQIASVKSGLGTTPGQPPPAATGPAIGTERVINGTPAIWDGKGWKAK